MVLLPCKGERKLTLAVSGANICIAWITNKTGNDEVIYIVQ
jgi:hypothetical protein